MFQEKFHNIGFARNSDKEENSSKTGSLFNWSCKVNKEEEKREWTLERNIETILSDFQ